MTLNIFCEDVTLRFIFQQEHLHWGQDSHIKILPNMYLSMSRRTPRLHTLSRESFFNLSQIIITFPFIQMFRNFFKFLFSIEYSPKLNNLLLTAVHILNYLIITKPFPDSSVDKESPYNAGDSSSIPGSGRSAGDGIDYPFQYSGVSLVAQLVKNLPAMRETWVPSLAWEDPLEKGKAAHCSVLAWRIPWTVQLQRVGHHWATFTLKINIGVFSTHFVF